MGGVTALFTAGDGSGAENLFNRLLQRGEKMAKDHYGPVQLKEIKPMRVACFKAVSATPEEDSLGHMKKWLAERDLGAASGTRIFGFDAEVTSEQQKELGSAGTVEEEDDHDCGHEGCNHKH